LKNLKQTSNLEVSDQVILRTDYCRQTAELGSQRQINDLDLGLLTTCYKDITQTSINIHSYTATAPTLKSSDNLHQR